MEITNSSLICDNKNAKTFSLLFVKLIVNKVACREQVHSNVNSKRVVLDPTTEQ